MKLEFEQLDKLISPASFLYLLTPAIVASISCKCFKQEWYPFVKPLPLMLLLSPLTISSYVILGNPFFLCIAIGLFLGLIGDVLLLNPNWFLQGLIAFLIGHNAYTVGFIISVPWGISALVCISWVSFSAAYLILSWYFFKGNKFCVPVLSYMVVIEVMAMTAINFEAVLGREIPYVAIGAILFCISDSILAWDKFYAQLPMSPILVLATYYAAQACIAWGTIFDLKLPNKLSI